MSEWNDCPICGSKMESVFFEGDSSITKIRCVSNQKCYICWFFENKIDCDFITTNSFHMQRDLIQTIITRKNSKGAPEQIILKKRWLSIEDIFNVNKIEGLFLLS